MPQQENVVFRRIGGRVVPIRTKVGESLAQGQRTIQNVGAKVATEVKRRGPWANAGIAVWGVSNVPNFGYTYKAWKAHRLKLPKIRNKALVLSFAAGTIGKLALAGGAYMDVRSRR